MLFAINSIVKPPLLVKEIKEKKYLPIKAILELINIRRKVIERHRDYIITAVIILTGDYGILKEYFKDEGGA